MGKVAQSTALPTSQQLGRMNANYARLRARGITVERLDERMNEDAQVFGISLEKYKELLADIGKKSGEGKRAALKAQREKVQAVHHALTSFLNEIKTKGSTDLAEMQKTLVELGTEAKDWVLMTAVGEDKKSGEVLFTINDSGWNDGSNRSRQYADRPQMVGKSGSRVTHPYLIHGS